MAILNIYLYILVFFYVHQTAYGNTAIKNWLQITKSLEKTNLVQLWMQMPHFADILDDARRIVNEENLSQDCIRDVLYILPEVQKLFVNGSLTNHTDFIVKVVLPMVDASAKIEPGIMRGRSIFIGLYSECRNIKYMLEKEKRLIEGGYNRFYIDSALRDNKDPNACKSEMNRNFAWGIDICLPKSCSNHEDLLFMGSLLKLKNDVKPVCSAITMAELARSTDYKTWIVVAVMLIIFITAIIATICEYYHQELNQIFGCSDNKSKAMEVLLAFSLHSNIGDIFSTENAKKSGQIGPLHFLRLISLIWILIGHVYITVAILSGNILDTMEILKDQTTQFITNAFFAVDTFFFISGLLVSFLWFKNYHKNPRKNMSLYAWIMFYVHRILRLSPPYFMVIAFYTFVEKTLFKNSPLYLIPFDDFCEQNWWINFLYLNNFIHYKKQCYLISWYLATDFQMYIFSPIILVALAIKPIIGIVISAIIILLSTVANAVTIVKFYFPPTDFIAGAMDPRMKDYNQYTLLIYSAPWIRCQVYIIGILTGYFLQTVKKIRIPRLLNVVLWLLSLGIGIYVILVLKDWANGKLWSLTERALYSSLSKIAWGLALSYIIISCFYGYGGFINDFMSWHVWIPFGRLTYCSYLIHFCVVFYFFGMSQSTVIFNGFPHVFTFFILPIIILTIFFAVIWSVFFEIPFGKVEAILFGFARARKIEAKNVEENRNADGARHSIEEITCKC